jgi:hypothetical protein
LTLDAYHGTPHLFPPSADNPLGEFDSSKIGTGEGNQSYGHGHYLSELPKVATNYKNTLALGRNQFEIVHRDTGEPVSSATLGYQNVKDFFDTYAYNLRFDDKENRKKRWKEQKEMLVNDKIPEALQFAENQNIDEQSRRFGKEIADKYQEDVKHLDAAHHLIDKVNAKPVGSVYTVNIPDEHVERMLDWDKPLSEQPYALQSIGKNKDFVQYAERIMERSLPELDGKTLQRIAIGYAEDKSRTGAQGAAKLLKEAGIFGIKYLDAGSRYSNAGTRNFVVFPGNEKHLKILKREADGGAVYKAKGGNVKTEDAQKTIRRALMVARDAKAIGGSEMGDEETPSSLSTNQPAASTRTMISTPAPNSEGVKGIVVPRHMLEGRTYAGEKRGGEKVAGMNEINAARAAVYGSENRNPLKVGSIQRTHKAVLDQHFKKSIPEQISAENEALSRLRKAKHIGENANTLDSSEKTDTVKYEPDPYEPWTSKGIAGYALYTSGHGDNEVKHVLKTCPGQTDGCGGGVDENGIVDTSKGTCFAPNAESQYVNAAVRRACHEQAKFDPAMTKDWILAHVGSLRSVSEKADKKGKKTMFRPNVVDETDRSSRHVIEGLNAQRSEKGLPPIIANSYGKTNELHDPENGYYVTHSNVGPKVKNGALIGENVSRDKQRIRGTILAADPQDFVNKQGNLTPAKNSYLVTDVKRYSDLDKRMQGAITHAKYWSAGRDERDLRNTQEDGQEPEAHFDGQGNPTTPDKAHYGHITLNGLRYDYQKQHILHPRMVSVPFTVTNKETGKKETKIKKIPTDSRFKDNDFLPPDEERFKAKNGKLAGAILMTTPTESTSHLGHETSFTHHVDDAAVDHALRNNGEYEIDSPMTQEAAKNKRFAAPQPLELKMRPKAFARGGAVEERDEDYSMGLPEQHFHAQKHIGHTHDHEEGHAMPHGHGAMPVNGPVVDRALHLVSHLSRR